MTRLLHALALGLLASGCVAAAPDADPQARCNVEFSCRSDEVCEVDGKCYGVPTSPQTLSLEIIPPEGSAQYVRSEVAAATLEGNHLVVVVDKPFEMKGQVLQGTERISARVVARRPSTIPGRPEYVVESLASPDRGYSLLLPAGPKTKWSFVVHPLSTSAGTQMVEGPPIPFSMEIESSMTYDFKLPNAFKKARGKIVDSVGRPVVGVSVQLFGKLDTFQGLAVELLASQSTQTIADGSFQLSVPLRIHSEFRVVVNGGQRKLDMPEVSFPGIFIPDPQTATDIHDIGAVILPVFSAPQRFTFRLHGITSAGVDAGAVGAKAVFATEWDDAPDVACDGASRCARFAAEGFADASGTVAVDLLPGTSQKDRPYRVLILTTSESGFASKSSEVLTVGALGGVGEDISLERKVNLTGRVVDAQGMPHAGVQIIARPALDSKVGLSTIEQTLIDAIQVPSTVTPMAAELREQGTFILAVEPSLLVMTSNSTSYDLEVIPPGNVPMPRFFIDDVEVNETTVDPMTRSLDLGERIAPEAVLIRGVVLDSTGLPIDGARVLVYEPAPPTACARLVPVGDPCVLPPRLLAVSETSTANLDSGFTAILPRR